VSGSRRTLLRVEPLIGVCSVEAPQRGLRPGVGRGLPGPYVLDAAVPVRAVEPRCRHWLPCLGFLALAALYDFLLRAFRLQSVVLLSARARSRLPFRVIAGCIRGCASRRYSQ
jgi:hypothetical protein